MELGSGLGLGGLGLGLGLRLVLGLTFESVSPALLSLASASSAPLRVSATCLVYSTFADSRALVICGFSLANASLPGTMQAVLLSSVHLIRVRVRVRVRLG